MLDIRYSSFHAFDDILRSIIKIWLSAARKKKEKKRLLSEVNVVFNSRHLTSDQEVLRCSNLCTNNDE